MDKPAVFCYDIGERIWEMAGMKKTMYLISAGAVLLTAVCAVLYHLSGVSFVYSLAITFGTIAYHFLMRLCVGFAFNAAMRNRADYTNKWFQSRAWERKLYQVLRVKHWKNKLPTFDADVFDPRIHTWDEIAQAMCQSELVHEVIVVLSFVPPAFAVLFGAFWAFLITSVLAAAFDLLFVMIQRYNRPRIIKLIKREQRVMLMGLETD